MEECVVDDFSLKLWLEMKVRLRGVVTMKVNDPYTAHTCVGSPAQI